MPGGGRTKGSRNQLSEQFFIDFLEAWHAHGKVALMKVAQRDPSTFLRVAASILPREVKVETDFSNLTEEQLMYVFELSTVDARRCPNIFRR